MQLSPVYRSLEVFVAVIVAIAVLPALLVMCAVGAAIWYAIVLFDLTKTWLRGSGPDILGCLAFAVLFWIALQIPTAPPTPTEQTPQTPPAATHPPVQRAVSF